MATVWVVKDDGTLQCEKDNPGIPLDEMKKELEKLGATVLNSEKRQDCRIIIAQCGAPTGQVNAYEISESDWREILSGIIGPNGFREWDCDGQPESFLKGGEIPWPMLAYVAQNNSVRKAPALVRELIGHPCRCYYEGDALTQDYIPNRVNIEKKRGSEVIQDIWFG